MNPVYLVNPPPSSPFHPLIEPTEDQHLQLFNPSSEASYSSLSNSIFSNPAQVQGGSYDREQQEQQHHQQQQQQQHKAIKCSVLQVSSSYHHEFLESPPLPTVENGLNNGLQASVCERDDRDVYQSNGGVRSIKWMSSKMRLMRKMTKNSTGAADKQLRSRHKFKDHQQPSMSSLDTDDSSNTSTNKSNTNNSTVRICSDCNTTKTPLWRSGPRGPKSLCNACGIRQRKARCAMAAAAAASGELLGNDISAIRTNVPKEKRSDNGYVQQYKKRCKLTGPRTRKKLCVEDFTINLSKNSAFHRVFPQDEKEAAILLMALSCGLVRG